jgi:hypothetical protein
LPWTLSIASANAPAAALDKGVRADEVAGTIGKFAMGVAEDGMRAKSFQQTRTVRGAHFAALKICVGPFAYAMPRKVCKARASFGKLKNSNNSMGKTLFTSINGAFAADSAALTGAFFPVRRPGFSLARPLRLKAKDFVGRSVPPPRS